MASNCWSNPRIHFKGKYVADVPTSNNDHGQNIDVGTLALYIKNPDGSLQANYTDEEFQKWVSDSVNNPGNAGYWNLNGSNSFWWEDTHVTSVEIDGNLQPKDPLSGKSVELLGHLLHGNRTKPKMVDLDMSGIYTSQIFSGELRLGGASGKVPLLVGSDPSISHNRIFNFNQISTVNYPKYPEEGPFVPQNEGCSGSFKFVIKKEKLALDNEAVKASPVLATMKKALDEGRADGISVRYMLFNTIHPTKWLTLTNLDRPPTPAYGSVYGTIELWNYRDVPNAPVYEPMGVPAGRLLTYKDPIPGVGTADSPQHLSPSWLKVDENKKILTMDMLATVPFASRDDSKYWAVASKYDDLNASLVPTLGPKVNFGDFKLYLNTKDKQEIFIGDIPYSTEYYNNRNGIAEITFAGKATVQQVREGTFVAKAKDTKTGKDVTLLIEEPVTFNGDQVDIYLDHNESTDLSFHAYQAGQPWANKTVYIFQYFNTNNFPDSDLQFATSAVGTVDKPQIVTFDPFCPGYHAGIVGQTTTNDKGVGTISIRGTFSGAAQLLFVTELPPNGGFVTRSPDGWDDVYWVGVRVLPNDSHLLRAPLEERLSWDFVKKNVLRYYYLLYPTMATRFSLIDPNEVKTKGFMIAEMINTVNFDKTWFMPVTREMSSAKRRILTDYILASRPDVTPVTPIVPVPQPESHPYDAHFAIKTRDQLLYALTIAADQEQGLMLQYLFGAWSLKQPEEMIGWPKERVEKVTKWRDTIIEVAKQEMLHLGYVMNLVNAVGGAPHFFDINFPQNKNYFSPGIQFKLTKFSIDTVRRFAKFEQPYEAIVADWLFQMSKRYDAVKNELINKIKQRQNNQKGQSTQVKSSLISSVRNDDGSEEIEFKDNTSKSSLSNSTRKKSANKDTNKSQSGKAQQQKAQKSQDPVVEDQMREAWMLAVNDPDVRALVPHKEWIDLNPQQRQDWLTAYRKFIQQDQNKSFLLRGVQDYRKHVDLNQLFATSQPYPTISTLYEQLRKVFETNAIPNLFLGPQSAQVYGFFKEQQAPQFGHLGPIRNAKDAINAIDLIIEQGEGGPECVVENGQFIPRKDSHFGKFMQILHEIAHEDRDWFQDAVRPVVNNPATRVHEDNLGEESQVNLVRKSEVPLTFYTMVIFNAVYETMLLVLYRFFGSSDNSSTDTTTLYKLFSPLMKSILTPLANLLTILPADKDGFTNAGPSFEVLKSSNYMPFRHVAFEIIKERLEQITEAVDFILDNFRVFNKVCAKGQVPIKKAPPPLKSQSGVSVQIEQERPSLIPDDREKNVLENTISDFAVSNSTKSFLIQDKLEEIYASLNITLQSFNAIEQDKVRTTPVTAEGPLVIKQ